MDMRTVNKIKNTCLFATRAVLVPVLGYLLVNGLTDYEESGFFFATQPRWILALLTVCMVLYLHYFLRCMWSCLGKMTEKRHRRTRVVLILSALFLQVFFLLYYRSSYLFDNAFVTGGASSLAQSGQVAPEAVYYLSSYPNQNAYVMLTALLWKAGSALGMSRGTIPLLLNLVNMLCLDSAVVLFFLIIKESKPDITQDRWTFLHLLMFLNPFLYIGVSYYYTITLSMPFVMLLFYFYVKYLRHDSYKGVWIPIGMGVTLGVGYLLRATTIIPAIAIAFGLLLFGKRRKKDLLVLLTALLCIAGIGRINSACIGLDTKDTAFPATHWIMMSMTPPGSHNAEDESYTASYATAGEKKQAVAERIVEKAQNMSGWDFAALLLAKIKNTWGSGASAYTVYLEHCLGTGAGYQWIFGNHRDFMILYHQGYYLLLLCWILYDVVLSVIRSKTDSYVCQLTFLGAVFFYTLWETGAQYKLPFLFVLMLLAAHGMDERVSVGKSVKKRAVARIPFGVCLLFLAFFFVKNVPVFTELKTEENNLVITQILANEEFELRDGEILEQTFQTDRSFNQIIFQWRNSGEASDAVYMAEVCDKEDNVIYSRQIEGTQPGGGAVLMPFDLVQPRQREEFVIRIYKTAGSRGSNLRFVTYKMGLYDAYPYGTFTLNGQEQTRDMLLAVSEIKNTAYCEKGFYFMIVLLIMAAGLFLLLYDIPEIKTPCRQKGKNGV